MASLFSGKDGRKASVAVGMFLGENQDKINDRIQRGKTSAIDALRSGYKSAKSWYDDARDLYDPYAETGGKAFDLYADALGVNGDEGYERAVGSFRASPGHEWMVDQATDAVARKASATGALASGNTFAAIADRAGHMADQEWDDHLTRLDGMGRMGYDATGKKAAITAGIGDLGMQYGAGKAGIIGDATSLGVNSQMQTGLAQSGALKDGMTAGQEAAGNRFGALMGGLSLAGKAIGSIAGMPVAGGGSVGGNLFNKWFG